jgi:hypothetical protein
MEESPQTEDGATEQSVLYEGDDIGRAIDAYHDPNYGSLSYAQYDDAEDARLLLGAHSTIYGNGKRSSQKCLDE